MIEGEGVSVKEPIEERGGQREVLLLKPGKRFARGGTRSKGPVWLKEWRGTRGTAFGRLNGREGDNGG